MKLRYISASCIISSALIFRMYSLEASVQAPIPNLSCSYAGKFEECVVANKNNNPRGIDSFECMPTGNYSDILDQIILDEKFREIQEEKLEFVEALSEDKELVVEEPNRVIDDISKNFGKEDFFHKKYQEVCAGGILKERLECTQTAPITLAALRVDDPELDDECMTQANMHLDIFSRGSAEIAKENKSTVLNDKHKEYVQSERESYGVILSTMQQILGHTERINPTHYTPDPLQ